MPTLKNPSKTGRNRRMGNARYKTQRLIDDLLAEEVFESRVEKFQQSVEEESKKKKVSWLMVVLIPVLIISLITVALVVFFLPELESDKKLAMASIADQKYSTKTEDLLVEQPLLEAYQVREIKTLENGILEGIDARGIYVISPEMHRIFVRKGAEARIPVASLTKIMTAIASVEAFDRNEQICVLEETDLYGSIDLAEDDCFSRDELITHMLASSSNDAAAQFRLNAEAKSINLITNMNELAFSFGLKNTKYQNEIGLDENDMYSSAEDSAKLMEIAIQNPVLFSAMGTKDGLLKAVNTGTEYEYETTNALIDDRDDIVAGKTGFTQNAGGDLVVLWKEADKDYSLIAVILGAKDEDIRFESMDTLLDLVIKRFDL